MTQPDPLQLLSALSPIGPFSPAQVPDPSCLLRRDIGPRLCKYFWKNIDLQRRHILASYAVNVAGRVEDMPLPLLAAKTSDGWPDVL